MIDNDQLNELIHFADILADESQDIITHYFRKKISIESKKDQSPVTIADKNTELKIRDLINKK